MPSLDNFKEEIHDIFLIFDEDESGSISLPELTRAIYTITGERTPRSALLRLIAAARESIAKETAAKQQREKRQRLFLKKKKNDETAEEGGEGGGEDDDEEEEEESDEENNKNNKNNNNNVSSNSDGVDAEVFERVVLRLVRARSHDEELAFTFRLLEDAYYPGFITKESLKRAAAGTEEPLTDAEIAEMFDALVTGLPAAAIDFTTFANVQAAAGRLEDQ